MISQYDSKTILAYGLFTNDVRATVTRSQLYLWVTLASLAFSEADLTLTELQAQVSADLNLPQAVPIEHLREAISSAINRGYVIETQQDDEIRYQISEARREALRRASLVHDGNRKEFSQHLSTKCREYLGEELSPEFVEIVTSEVEYLLERAFCESPFEESQEIAQNGDRELRTPESSLDSLATRVRKEAERRSPDLKITVTRSQILQEAVKEAFWDLPKPALRHVISLHHRVIYSYILRLDPNLQRFDRQLLRKRILFLDTNVILDYLFPGRYHESAREVLGLCKEFGCTLAVSPATIEELEFHLFTRTKDHFRLFSNGDEKINLLVLNGEGAVVLGNFLKSATEPTWESLDRYLGAFRPLDRVLERHGITILGDQPEVIKSDENYGHVYSKMLDAYNQKQRRLLANRDFQARLEPVEHDTQLYLAVHRLRKDMHGDAMGSQVWALTRDYSVVMKAQRWLRRTFPSPAAKSLDEWGSFLIGFKSPNVTSLQFDDYVKVLIGSKLGLVSEDQAVDVDFLAILAKNDLLIPQLRNGSAEDVQDHIRQIQQDQEVQSLVSQLTSAEDEAQRANLRAAAIDVMEKIMSAQNERPRLAKDEARARLMEENDELAAAARREAVLQAQLEELGSRLAEVNEKLTTLAASNDSLAAKLMEHEENFWAKMRRLLARLFRKIG